MQAQPNYRYQLTFGKGKEIKYLAHLDIVLAWTRIFRRANIPLAYSNGFNPQAKIKVAAGLPVGSMGEAELMDVFLTEPLSPDDILNRARETLPPGFTLSTAEAVDLKAPGLQADLKRAEYEIIVETDVTEVELEARIETLLAQKEVRQSRIRRKKEEVFNLRPLLHNLSLAQYANGEATLTMCVSTGQQGNLRPDAVLKALDLDKNWYQDKRTKLIFNI